MMEEASMGDWLSSNRGGDVPTLFHGTGLEDAPQMATNPGQIDVTSGGGEFGRGFYTQYSAWHARAWAIRVAPRLNGLPCVLRLDIDDAGYGALAFLYLDAVTGPALTARLQQTQQEATWLEGTCDAIEGPTMGNMARMQQKFESVNAQTLLNGNSTTRTVIP
jgi:hypothetical protein